MGMSISSRDNLDCSGFQEILLKIESDLNSM